MSPFHPRSSLTRRAFGGTVAAAVLALVAACGDSGEPSGESGDSASIASYPVSVEHKYGTSTIEQKPERVVVVGLTEQDALLALGTVPVATTEWFGDHPGAIFPWATDKLNGAKAPEVLNNNDGVQFEKVAAQRPDLIVAMYSNLSQQDYDTLSKIAPVLAQPKGQIDYAASYSDITTAVGAALGKPDEAKKLLDDTAARFEKAKADNPSFAGKTGLVATEYEGYYVYGPDDPRGKLMENLGFTLPEGLAAATGQEFGATLSKENTDLLDVDALVMLVTNYEKSQATFAKDRLFSALAVRTEGRDVVLEDLEPLGSATSFLSVLSIPYLLDGLTPQLAAAVDGDPATTVERDPSAASVPDTDEVAGS